MRAAGPEPLTWVISTPISRARRRVEGAAGTSLVGVVVAAAVIGAGGVAAARAAEGVPAEGAGAGVAVVP